MVAFLEIARDAEGNFGAALVLLFALLIGHAIGDYALQNDFLARAKARRADLSGIFPNGAPRGLWFNALFAHSLIHAGTVWVITGSVVLAAIELALHFTIDFIKGEGRISFSMDQTLHRLCKVGYVAILYLGPDWVTWSPA